MLSTIPQRFCPMENIPACISADHIANVLWKPSGIFDSEVFLQCTEVELLGPYKFNHKMQILWRLGGTGENHSFEYRHLHFIYIPFSVGCPTILPVNSWTRISVALGKPAQMTHCRKEYYYVFSSALLLPATILELPQWVECCPVKRWDKDPHSIFT